MAREDMKPLVKAAVKGIEEKLGFDVAVLDISKVSIMAEYFVIATANNPNQLRAVRESVEFELSKLGVKLNHAEGLVSSRWVLLDFSDIIVHLFCSEERAYYNLEQMWEGAETVDIEEIK